MLVLSPTRELAAQIADNMRGYAKHLNLSIQCIFGGIPAGKQARALVPGCDVLVATGRLLDLIDQRALTLRDVEIFVLDEADQMMDLGFIVPLKRVAPAAAAAPEPVLFRHHAAGDRGTGQAVHQQSREGGGCPAIHHRRARGAEGDLRDAGRKAGAADADAARRAGRGRRRSHRPRDHLHPHQARRRPRGALPDPAGIEAAAIHGDKSQAQRTAALKGFREGRIKVLVATDIAARGIDVSGVSHVFNFELPNVAEQYVHRIGRTARRGRWVALSFVAEDERPYLRAIERLTGVKLAILPLPADFLKEAARLPAPASARAAASSRARAAARVASAVAKVASAIMPAARMAGGDRRPGQAAMAPAAASRAMASVRPPSATMTAPAPPAANERRDGEHRSDQRAPRAGGRSFDPLRENTEAAPQRSQQPRGGQNRNDPRRQRG
jgi:ATP-dependent RNA helicase RhlE